MTDTDQTGTSAGNGATATRLTLDQIADDIVAYLPNPGGFQNTILAAVKEEDGTVTIAAETGQEFRLQIEEVPVEGTPTAGLTMEDRNLITTALNLLLIPAHLRDLGLEAWIVEDVRRKIAG